MTEISEIRQLIYDFIEDYTVGEEALRYIGFAIKNVERHASPTLRATADVTVDEDGIMEIPARCREITKITSQKTTAGAASYEFHALEDEPTQEQARLRKYWAVPYAGADLDEDSCLCSFSQGGNVITCVSGETFFDSDCVGKEVVIQGSSQPMEILAFDATGDGSITVAPEISASTSSSTLVTLMPAGRDRMRLYTPDLAPFEGTVTVTYQKSHPEPYAGTSKLLIPCDQSVAYLAIQMFQQTNKYDVDAERLAMKVAEARQQEISGRFFSKTKKATGSSRFAVRSKRGE